jgi:hypothetical protein
MQCRAQVERPKSSFRPSTLSDILLLAGALRRGDRVIVADPNGAYYSRFGEVGDTVLNPFDHRSVGWSIFNEIEKPYDVQRYARSVIPDARSAQDVEWHGYAQLLFAETALRLIEAGNNTVEFGRALILGRRKRFATG